MVHQAQNKDVLPADGAVELEPASGAGIGAESSILVNTCIEETEALFQSGSHHCAEAVAAVVLDHFAPQACELVVQLASGLGGGSGVGCICGSLSAAPMVFAAALPGEKEQVAQLTRSMHLWFRKTYGASCCRALQNREPEQGCRVSPGAVAGKIAELLLALDEGRWS